MMSQPPDNKSEFIINPDGSIYHLHLHPHQIAETIITVGDPKRVHTVSKHFDSITHRVEHREFITNTGYLNNKKLTVISTGIGTGNIDIVLNELDALVNMDFETQKVKDTLTSLNIIRLGTSGSVSEEIEIDSVLVTSTALGLDNSLKFYGLKNSAEEAALLNAFAGHLHQNGINVKPYLASADEDLLTRFALLYPKGTTITAPGFYAPQGRRLRLPSIYPDFIGTLNRFRQNEVRITNLEMETACIYGLGKLLGHHCLSLSAILANRINNTFSSNPERQINKMILEALEVIVAPGNGTEAKAIIP
jgi:uridine phosphorylase